MPRPGAVPVRARTQPAAQSQPMWRRPGWADAVALAGVGALALYAAAAAGAAQARATAREELIVKLGIAGAGRLDGEDGVAHSLAAIAEHMHALDRERARRNGDGRGERGGDGGDARADIAAVFGADSADGAVMRAAEGLLRGRGWFDFYFSNLMLRAAEAPADFGVAADEMQVWVPGQEKAYLQTYWEPVVSCTFERRLGKRGDGGKWACDPDQLLEHGRCAIASVGSENEWSFETEVLERYACDFVHTFDHTVYDPTPPRGATFHPLKLSAADDEAERTISVAGVVRMLPPGRVLDILKIDIEGGEYFMLAHNASLDAMARSVRVLMIEVHMCSNFVPEPDPDWEKLCSVNTPAAERLEPWACADYNASGYKEYRAHIKAEEERLAREEQERMRQWERDWGGEWGDGGEDLGWGAAVEEGLETWYAWAAQDQAAEDAEVEAGASTGRSNTTTEARDGNKNAAAMVNATTGRGSGDENATVQSTTIEAKRGEGDEQVNAAVAAVLGVKGAERKGGGGTVGKDVSAGSATAPAVDGASGAAAAASVSAGGSTAEALPVLATGAQMRERFKAQLRVRPQRTARAGAGGVPAGPTTAAGRAAGKKTGDATVDSVDLTASATAEDGSTIATQGQHATQPEHSKESTTETQTATHPSRSRHQAQRRRPELRPQQLLSRAEQQQRFHAQHQHVQHVAEEHGLDEGEEDGQEEGTRRLAESLGKDGAGADSVLVGSEFDDYRGSFARLGEGAWDDALFEDGAGIGWGEDWISGRYSGDPWWMFEDGTASPYKYRHDMRQWVARLGQRLYDRGFRTYHKEINIQHTDGCCLEFALVNTNLLLEQAGGAGSGKESDGMGDEEETRSRQRRQRSRRHGQHEERMP